MSVGPEGMQREPMGAANWLRVGSRGVGKDGVVTARVR